MCHPQPRLRLYRTAVARCWPHGAGAIFCSWVGIRSHPAAASAPYRWWLTACKYGTPCSILRQCSEVLNGCRAMMSAVNLARAHLAVVMCFVNISLAMAFWKLSLEMKTHGQLQKSHAALQKQAAGISQEYSRMTAAMPTSKATSESDTDSSASKAELAAAKVSSTSTVLRSQCLSSGLAAV